MRVIFFVAGLAFALGTDAVSQDISYLENELRRLEALSGGTMGIAAVHLETGRSAFLNGDETFPMASTYKIPIAVQVLSRVDADQVALTDMIGIRPEDLHPGSGTLSRLFDDPGVVLSVLNLMELMLLISDNSATDVMLRVAGGADAVNQRLAELDVQGVRVDRPTSLLIADWLGVRGVPEDGQIDGEGFRQLAQQVTENERENANLQFRVDPRDTATPRGMADLLVKIWNGEAVSRSSTTLLLDILRRVETGEGRLKGMLPPGTVVGHKTGTIGATTNDAGIVYLPDGAGHVVVVAFVKDSDEPIPTREDAIAQATRAVYDYFLFVRN